MRRDTRTLEERTTIWSQAKYSVHGHPRAGNHYLMAVLNENFIHGPNRFRDYFGHNRLVKRHQHGLPEQSDPAWFDSGKHFYIWREFDGVAESILRMPERFGITRKLTTEEFKSSIWRDIYSPNVFWAWKQVHSLEEEGIVERGYGTAFGATFNQMAIDQNTYDFWRYHIECWRSFSAAKDNIFLVKYEDLLNSFQNTMTEIANWLDKPIVEFKQVEEKVSGQPL